MTWLDEQEKVVELKNYRGRRVLMTMAYTSCPAACPLLIKKLKSIEKEYNSPEREIHVVIITFDPTVDTPKVLREYKKLHDVNKPHWHFLNGTEETTRKLSNLLNLSYQKNLSTGHFTHDNKIILLEKDGTLLETQEGLDASPSQSSFWKKILRFFK